MKNPLNQPSVFIILRIFLLIIIGVTLSGCYAQKEVGFNEYRNRTAITKIEFTDSSQLFIHNQNKVLQRKYSKGNNFDEPILELILSSKNEVANKDSFAFIIQESEISALYTDNHYQYKPITNNSSMFLGFILGLFIW